MADSVQEIDVGSPTGPVFADLFLDNTNKTVTGNVIANLPIIGTINLGKVNGTIDNNGNVTINETIAGTGLVLNYTEGSPTATVMIDVGGSSVFSLTVPVVPVCYCSGTLIKTVSGQIPVENLAIGDLVVTQNGAQRAIRWIGRRDYTGRFVNSNPDLLPVCVKADAIADGVPARDLWVSPRHALFLEGLLIPAQALVNGRTIVRAERVESLAYWHVELDSHDVIIAENMPAESFVDDQGRGMFHNAASFRVLYPDAIETEAAYCAPRVESGHAVDKARRAINARAGLSDSPARFGALRGRIEIFDGSRLAGWARDDLYPGAPVCLDVLVDDELVALVYADQPRPDLELAGIVEGPHGFALDLPSAPTTARKIEVRRSSDHAQLTGSPLLTPASAARAA